MGKEIFVSASPGKSLGKEIIDISYGITLLGKEISIMGKEIFFLSCPGRLTDKVGKPLKRRFDKVLIRFTSYTRTCCGTPGD